MGERMSWEKISDYCVTNGEFSISKAFVNDRVGYELWHNGKPPMIGRFDTFSEARDAAEREKNRMKRGKEND